MRRRCAGGSERVQLWALSSSGGCSVDLADPHVLTRRKPAEIGGAIAAYERKAEEARRDLAAINAAIRLFSVEVGAEHVASYMDIYRLAVVHAGAL
jgi:hypothetical protein